MTKSIMTSLGHSDETRTLQNYRHIFHILCLCLLIGGCPSEPGEGNVAVDATEVEQLIGEAPKRNHHIVAIDHTHAIGTPVPDRVSQFAQHLSDTALLREKLTEAGYTVLPQRELQDFESTLRNILKGEAGTVILYKPALSYSDRDLRALETFVFWGGRLVVFLPEDRPDGAGHQQLLERFGLDASAVIDVPSEVAESEHWVPQPGLRNTRVMVQDESLQSRLQPEQVVFNAPLRIEETGERTDVLEFAQLMAVKGLETDEELPVAYSVNHKVTSDLSNVESDIDSASAYDGQVIVVGNSAFIFSTSDQVSPSCMDGFPSVYRFRGGLLTGDNCSAAVNLIGGIVDEDSFVCVDNTEPEISHGLPRELRYDTRFPLTTQLPPLQFEACDPAGICKVEHGLSGNLTTVFDADFTAAGPREDRNAVDFTFSFEDPNWLGLAATIPSIPSETLIDGVDYEIRIEDCRGNLAVHSIPFQLTQLPAERIVFRSALPGESPPQQGIRFQGPVTTYPNESLINGANNEPASLTNVRFNGPSYSLDDTEESCTCKVNGQDASDQCPKSETALNQLTEVVSNPGGAATAVSFDGFSRFQDSLTANGWPLTPLTWSFDILKDDFGALVTNETLIDTMLPTFCFGGNTTERRRYQNPEHLSPPEDRSLFRLKFGDTTIVAAEMPDVFVQLNHGGNNSCNDDTICAETHGAVRFFFIPDGLSDEHQEIAEAFLLDLNDRGLRIRAVLFDRIERNTSPSFYFGVEAPWVENAVGIHDMVVIP